MSLTLPNLLIVGAQKAGTSWLHYALGHQSQVFMSHNKELSFFNSRQYHQTGGLARYAKNFEGAEDCRLVGESTPGYFWHREGVIVPSIPERVKATLSAPRIIVLLRNPTERAVSAYYHHYYHGRIPHGTPIEDTDPALGIVDMGHYQRHLEAWFALFDREQISIYLYDDLRATPRKLLQRILSDLDLPHDRAPGWRRQVNRRDALRERFDASNEGAHVTEESLARLRATYADDVAYTAALLQRDLSSWNTAEVIPTEASS